MPIRQGAKAIKKIPQDFIRIGRFLTEISEPVSTEFNKNKIAFHLEKEDEFYTAVYVHNNVSGEAEELLDMVKKKHKRVRF